MKFRPFLALYVASRAVPLAAAAGWVYFTPYPVERLAPEESVRVLDRHGRLIDELAGPDGTRRRWVSIDELPPHVPQMFVVAEDRRFWDHPGVDPRSVARALRDNLLGRRTGASTITMQVVRLIEPRPRTLSSKAWEAVLAIRLERAVSKRAILEQYLNRAPFGNRATGIEAAAQLYFAKPARDLSPAEAAYLAALPHAPTRLDPYRSDRALDRHHWILQQAGLPATEPIRPARSPRATVARHFPRLPGRTTLDLEIQERAEGIVRAHLRSLADRHVTSAGVVVLDNESGDILAMVGAPFRRGPGSTVKAFTYALAFERGRTPEDLVLDEAVHYETPTGDYSPRNYDGAFHGPVTLRVALASSLNIPAVRMLHDIGVETLHRRLRMMEWPLEPAERYGLGLTLGDGETTLLALTASYAALANGGEWRAPRWRLDDPLRRVRVFDPAAAAAVIDVLSDDDARAIGFGRGGALALPFASFAKTGTSPDYRDNWTVGGTSRVTVGVWVGNLDGSPMRGVSGITGAAPIWRDILLAVGSPKSQSPNPKQIPNPKSHPNERPAFEILHPNDWDVFYIDPSRPVEFQSLRLEARGAARWFVDGIASEEQWLLRRGMHEVVAVGPAGERKRRKFRVE